MKILCVDDENIVLDLTVSMCRNLRQVTSVEGFGESREALAWLETHDTDIAILDISMPDMDGLELAARIKERHPDVIVIFLTGYQKYALDAFRVHALGYLLKPVTQEQLQEEIEWAMQGRPQKRDMDHIVVQTFGEFNVFVDGKVVVFSRSKAKEALAYLVDRQGGCMSRAQIFATLLGDERNYDRAMQKYLDVILNSMRQTLEEYGIGEIIERKNRTFRVCPETFTCDLYRFFDGDITAVDAYRGEYMNAYSWASLTEAYVDRLQGLT